MMRVCRSGARGGKRPGRAQAQTRSADGPLMPPAADPPAIILPPHPCPALPHPEPHPRPVCTPRCAGTAATAPPRRPPPAQRHGIARENRTVVIKVLCVPTCRHGVSGRTGLTARPYLARPHLAWLHRRSFSGGVVAFAHAYLACNARQSPVVGIPAGGTKGRSSRMQRRQNAGPRMRSGDKTQFGGVSSRASMHWVDEVWPGAGINRAQYSPLQQLGAVHVALCVYALQRRQAQLCTASVRGTGSACCCTPHAPCQAPHLALDASRNNHAA